MTLRLWASRADQTAPPRYKTIHPKRVINLSLTCKLTIYQHNPNQNIQDSTRNRAAKPMIFCGNHYTIKPLYHYTITMKLLGIDDAGRGPVLGPMTLAGVIIDSEEQESEIKALNAKDSKLLTPLQRRTIAEKIKPQFKHFIVTSSPKQIDDSSNLNYLEAIKTAQIINHLTKDLTEKTKAIVDCPSVNIEAWSRDVQKLLENPDNIILSCEHKADANHPIVGAASILAKEKREEEIYKLKLQHKIDFGSGYPADPKTKKFIQENFDNEKYSPIIRFSWNTVKKLFKAKGSPQKKLF